MKPLDRFLMRLRIRQALPHVPLGGHVLDVGTYDGSLFEALGPRLGSGVGIDPHPARVGRYGRVEFVRGVFPDVALDGPFDCICMLAVIEHIPADRHPDVASACAKLLRPNGSLVMTVPSAIVDSIAKLLCRLRLLDGMDLDEHYGLTPKDVVAPFATLFRLVSWRKFEFGINNLLVFELR